MIPHAAGMDGIQRTPPFCGSWLPWLACTGISGRGAPAVRLPLPLPRYRRIVGWMACRPAGSPAVEQDVFMRTVPLSRKGVPAAGPMIGKERG